MATTPEQRLLAYVDHDRLVDIRRLADLGAIAFQHGSGALAGSTIALDREAIAAVVGEVGAQAVVLGLPVDLSGQEGPAAARVRRCRPAATPYWSAIIPTARWRYWSP